MQRPFLVVSRPSHIDFQTNTEEMEELKTAALMIGISIFTFLALLVVAVVLITRWWMS
jgi:hypothetical protein